MNRTVPAKVMIGYRPTLLESMKIEVIGEVFKLTNCAVIRELLSGHWTLDELYAIARKIGETNGAQILLYLRKAYSTKKSVEKIVEDAQILYTRNIQGIIDRDENTIWEFIND